jgi:hypothetical protein
MNPEQPQTLSLEDVLRYLSHRGWREIPHPNERLRVFEYGTSESESKATLSLPRSMGYAGGEILVSEAVRIIASIARLSTPAARDHISRWDRDILRVRTTKWKGTEASIPLPVASDLITGLKRLMGDAAYTERDPRPHFEKAGATAKEFTAKCRFGHTFEGSFGLRIECPFNALPALEGVQRPIPFERRVMERIAIGLHTLSKSVQSDSIDDLVSGFDVGLNANMCRALVDVFERGQGRRIEYDIAWSPELAPERVAADWQPVHFDGRAYELTMAAAKILEQEEPEAEATIEGRIVQLRSDIPPTQDPNDQQEHVVTMYWHRDDGATLKIRVPLTAAEYLEACDAHKDGISIRVVGIPRRSGKYWHLSNPNSFSVDMGNRG